MLVGVVSQRDPVAESGEGTRLQIEFVARSNRVRISKVLTGHGRFFKCEEKDSSPLEERLCRIQLLIQ